MDSEQGLWTRGRVTLVGDAASAVSLLAGQGTALAMVAAYILAGELHRSKGDFAEAFRRYQHLFGPFVLAKQRAALRFAGSFAPKSKLTLFLRNQLFESYGNRVGSRSGRGQGFHGQDRAPGLLRNGRWNP